MILTLVNDMNSEQWHCTLQSCDPTSQWLLASMDICMLPTASSTKAYISTGMLPYKLWQFYWYTCSYGAMWECSLGVSTD